MPSRPRRIRDELRAALAEADTISNLFWSADLVLRPAVGCQGGAWSLLDPATLLDTRCELIGDLGSGRMRIPNDPARERALFCLEWDDIDPNTFAALERDGRVAAALSLDVDDISSVRRYRDLLAPMGASDELRVMLRADAATWGCVVLYRFDGTCFTVGDVAVAIACAPILAREARRLVVLAACEKPNIDEGPGSFILGPDDQPLVLSSAAEALLSTVDEQSLPSAFRSLAVATRARGRASMLLVADDGAVVLHGSPAKGIDDAIAVVVERPRPATLAPLIVERFGLTNAERQVTELTLRGRTRAQVARSLAIGEHTVGDHLKSIYAKAGVNSRAELCALLFDRFYEPFRAADRPPSPYGHFLPDT